MQDNIHGRKMSTTLLWIISASTWGSDQTIRSNVQLNAARTENAVAKAPCLNPTGLYDPTKHKSILAVTYHLNRKQKSIFNKTIPCPRTVPTEHGTITKHNLQRMNARPYQSISYHIHRRKMSTILFWMHLCIHSKIASLPQFLTSNVHFVRKGCDRHLKIAKLLQFLTSNVHFARKCCGGLTKIAKLLQFLTSNVHFVRKGCRGHLKIAKLLQFLTSNVHFARKCCGGLTKIAVLPQFLTFNVHFVRKGCGGHLKIAILLRFWTSDVHEKLRLSRFVALR